MTARPSVLVVASSSCQLYSGTGTALFDWMRYASAALDFSLAIDTGEKVNFEIAAGFCREMAIPLLPSECERVPCCPDLRPAWIGQQLRARAWDVVECISWANAATNLEVLQNRPIGSRLVFTPHTQPIWTLQDCARYGMVTPVFERMLELSDLVMLDTPSEVLHMPGAGVAAARAFHCPLGVDTGRFRPQAENEAPGGPRLLAVADFREHRKRPDLLLRVLEMVLQLRPDITPVLAGRESDKLRLPPLMAAQCECLGYVSADELLYQYRSARAFLLLSDFEAFGLPIAEALCCGTPVVIHAQPETVSAFADLPGVSAIDNADLAGVRDALLMRADSPPDRLSISRAASSRFGFTATYGRKLERVLAMLGRSAGLDHASAAG